MKTTRQTRQKRLMEEELRKRDNFFSAEDFFRMVSGRDERIGIATVYRFLKGLREKNQLHSYVCSRRRVYSRKKVSHCHFLCEKTGNVIHFDVDSLDFLRDKIPGTIRSFQIEVRGTCDGCISENRAMKK